MEDWQTFWIAKQAWPRDYGGSNVFLAAAVDETGEALFADDWTGSEPLTPLERYDLWLEYKTDAKGQQLPAPISFPKCSASSAKAWEREAVRRLLLSRSPPIAIEVSTHAYKGKTYDFNDEVWRIGCAMAHDIDAERNDSWARFLTVQNKIRDGIAGGALVSVLRPLIGGGFSEPVKPTDWSTEQAFGRFTFCQMPMNPFGSGPKDNHLIFVTRDSLDRFKTALNAPILPGAVAIAAPPQRKRRTGQYGLIENWLYERHGGIPPAHMTEDQRTGDLHDYAENVAKSPLRPDPKTIRKAIREMSGISGH
ncbi:hypothetical protein ACYG9R_09235 [Mesorhizobium sp. RSR565B]|uniref:hypothetical protein n=1 Tax=Mesorhizobium sp. L103C565B0 TaxID=1287094 RepID=UPI0003CFA5E9|nr:hypothetical protein [Mesorhizobium sp. L103C565B0]ESZ50976.1 hypothetical protein X730_12085 [Mesorhizobium sp. L103C565B0]